MGIAFRDYRMNGSSARTNVIWQEMESLFPFKCDVCLRTFEQGGKRFIASSLTHLSHRATGCKCEDCQKGINPFKVKAPKLTERRTSLD